MEPRQPQAGTSASHSKHGQLFHSRLKIHPQVVGQPGSKPYPTVALHWCAPSAGAQAFSVLRGPVSSSYHTTSYGEVAGNTDPTALPHLETKTLTGKVENLHLCELPSKPQRQSHALARWQGPAENSACWPVWEVGNRVPHTYHLLL